MRLREYFDENEETKNNTEERENKNLQMLDDKIDAREKNKIFMPPSGRDINLDLYIESVKEEIVEGITCNKKEHIKCKRRGTSCCERAARGKEYCYQTNSQRIWNCDP